MKKQLLLFISLLTLTTFNSYSMNSKNLAALFDFFVTPKSKRKATQKIITTFHHEDRDYRTGRHLYYDKAHFEGEEWIICSDTEDYHGLYGYMANPTEETLYKHLGWRLNGNPFLNKLVQVNHGYPNWPAFCNHYKNNTDIEPFFMNDDIRDESLYKGCY